MLVNKEIVAVATSRLNRQDQVAEAPTRKVPIDLPVRRYVDANRAPQDTAAFERAIGTNDLLGMNYFWQGIKAARAVARILVAPIPRDLGGSATGFMIAPNLMLTNRHVFQEPEAAKRARAIRL
ncbi:hypothetical protein ACC718_32805 [Rhizobium ruizarguesonis]